MIGETFLFIYGSLLREINHPMSAILKHYASWVGKGYFYGKLFDLGEYPAAIAQGKGAEKVWGEIYRLNNVSKVIGALDEYEGIGMDLPLPQEYKREIITVHMENKSLPCWAYLYNGNTDFLTRIDVGDYLAFWKDRLRR